jgi:hypothetical protein
MPVTGPSPGAGAPPNSPPPAEGTPVFQDRGNGPIFGTQQRLRWAIGESDRRPLCDAVRADSLWRVSVIGDVDVFVMYGTSGAASLQLAAPVQGAMPGFLGLEAAPRDPNSETTAIVTLAPVLDAGTQALRAVHDAAGGAVALPNAAKSFQAYTAATLLVRGIAVAVPALQVVNLVSGSVLLTGSGVAEYAT